VLASEELASRPLGDGDHGVAPASAVDAGKTVELVVAEVLEEQAIDPARPDRGIQVDQGLPGRVLVLELTLRGREMAASPVHGAGPGRQ